MTGATTKRKMPAGLAKMTVDTVFIEPTEAVQILQKHNPYNRRIDRANVAKLAAQMESNQWQPGVAIIQFDAKGNLVDGQHTLLAIEKSNMGQWVRVIRGVPTHALNVINTGKTLTLTDHPDIKDRPNKGVISSTVRFIYRFDSGLRGQQLFGAANNYSSSMTGSFTDLLQVFHDNEEDILAYAALGAKVARAIPISAGTVAIAAWMFYQKSPEDAEAFFDKLSSGLDLDKDSPIYVLRERIITDLSNKNSVKTPQRIMIPYLIKAWNFYRNGQTIGRLFYNPGGSRPEPFPEAV